jgi:hypothetical protein
MPAGVPVDREWQGPGGLPIGCRFTSQELINAAREMRAVRTAIWEFQSRGYVAVPGADIGRNGCSRGQPSSAVVLAYTKPGTGYVGGDSTKYALPMIVVATALSEATGEPATIVTGGLIVVDGVARKFHVSDDATDTPFDVVVRRQGGPMTRLPAEGIAGEGAGGDPVYEIDDWNGFVKGISRWAGCTGAASWGCVAGIAVRPGGVLLFSNPETAAGVVGGCMVGTGIGCALGMMVD